MSAGRHPSQIQGREGKREGRRLLGGKGTIMGHHRLTLHGTTGCTGGQTTGRGYPAGQGRREDHIFRADPAAVVNRRRVGQP